jgi:SNF2 family DNA or RNA helicase
MKRFNSADEVPFCIVMTTQTGGISLNLEEAGSVHALDETWNPDDQEQLFDRGDRGSRTTPLKCYTYRSRDTIQEYIAGIVVGKRATNQKVLDLRKSIADATRIAD